eukprot:scaffold7.g3707.t1
MPLELHSSRIQQKAAPSSCAGPARHWFAQHRPCGTQQPTHRRGSASPQRRGAASAAPEPQPQPPPASSTALVPASPEWAVLRAHKVYAAGSGREVDLTSLWEAEGGKCVVAFLTHFADLSSTELAEKLLPLRAAGVGLVAVGLGEPDKGARFAELVGFPQDLLYADPTGDLYRALGFNRGFAPDAPMPAHAKLLAMLAGLGSPGTIPEVLRGYRGDRGAAPVFASGGAGGKRNLFDVLGAGYQRPLELATLRLFNMGLVLQHWSELAPANERLLTQQGGCIGFEGRRVAFMHVDRGILTIADPAALVAAMAPSAPGGPAAQTLRPLF